MKISDFTSPLFRLNRQEDLELGFGTKITNEGGRLVNKDGTFNVKRKGARVYTPYQWLVEMSWSEFFAYVCSFYIASNALFASLFVIIGVDNLSGVEKQNMVADFGNAFFFSVQTFTTVGYGSISPNSFGADMIASTVALVGLMSFALATGLFFARFAKPKAQLLFSNVALIAPYKKGNSFQFRIANLRNNNIIDAEAKVAVTWLETDESGNKRRRFNTLNLEIDKIALLPLNWTLVHAINESSPLWGLDEKHFRKASLEFIVQIKAYDESFAQQVNTNSSYICSEIIWNKKFLSMYHPEGSTTVLDLDKIDSFCDTVTVDKATLSTK